VRLGDVCVINPKTPVLDENLTVSFIPMPKVGENGEFDPSEIREYCEVKKGFTYFEDGDILFAKITPCMENGKGAVARSMENGIGFGSTEFHVLRPNTEIVIGEWIYYLLSWPVFRKEAEKNMTGSAGQKRVSKSFLEAYQVILPALKEQNQQIDTLQKIDKLISLRKQQLAKLDELVKARFVEMFGDCLTNPKGWKTKCLEDIAEVGSSKRVFVEELQEDGIPFYRGTEVGALAEGKQITPELFITEQHYAELCIATGAPRIGDLLMPSICPDGRIWVVNTDAPFYFKDGRVLWVHAIDTSYNPVFLLYTLKDRIMTDYSSIASGTTFAELKIFALKKCRVFDVPLTLQNQFAAFVEQTDKSKSAIQQSFDKLETLKKALMQKYFG